MIDGSLIGPARSFVRSLQRAHASGLLTQAPGHFPMTRAILLALLLGGCGVATEEQSAPPEPALVSGKQSKPCRVSASDCGEAVAYSCSEPTEAGETGSNITGESHKPADCYPTDATSQSWCCKVR